MAGIKDDDVVLVFSANPFGPSQSSFLGVETDGEIVELYNAATEYIDMPLRPELEGQATTRVQNTSFATIDDDLYFHFTVIYYAPGSSRAQGFDTQIARFTSDGDIEMVFLEREALTLNTGGGVGGIFTSAVNYNGSYVIPLDVGYESAIPDQLLSVPSEGPSTTLTDFTRTGAHISSGFAALGDELYFVADERSPLENFTTADELWRLNPDGSQEYLWENAEATVLDLATFADEVWFSVGFEPGVRSWSEETELYRIGPGGTPVEVDLSAFDELRRTQNNLKVFGEALYMLTAGSILKIEADGSATDLLAAEDFTQLWDIIEFDGHIYFVGDNPSGSQLLYRIETTGAVTLIDNIPYNDSPPLSSPEFPFGSVRELTVAAETLYFTAFIDVDDGFGGEMGVTALMSLGADGTVTQISEMGGENPDLTEVNGLFAFATSRGPVVPDDPLNLVGGPEGDRLLGDVGNDSLDGGLGSDTLNGGDGDDTIIGGPAEGDLRDVVFAGDGNDSVDAGAGNDQVFGQGGNDTIAGGFGVDELQGQDGNDVITGSAFSDLVFGGAGNDFVNGGFGSDRINGGIGADKFFHVGVRGHGSDWLQDYTSAEGDVLLWGGGAATADDFQVNFAHTENAEGERAGVDDVTEGFVIYKPTVQILWALVDGGGQDAINIQIGSEVFDLLG